MSIKARLKKIEGQLQPDDPQPIIPKMFLLFMDNQEFREKYIEFLAVLDIDDFEKAVVLKLELERLYDSLEPQLSPAKFDSTEFDKLVSYEIKKYLDEHPEVDKWHKSNMTDQEKEKIYYPYFVKGLEE